METCIIVQSCPDVYNIKYVSDLHRSLCNKNRHKEIFKGIQFIFLIIIMTICEMKFGDEIKSSMKLLSTR